MFSYGSVRYPYLQNNRGFLVAVDIFIFTYDYIGNDLPPPQQKAIATG